MSANWWNGTWRGISPDGQIHNRVRQVISPSGGIVRGKFPSRKNGRMIYHEGLLELDAIYLFEASPLVVSYREQPYAINYPDGSRLRRYTPDFELTLRTGKRVLIEVKPFCRLESDEVRNKLNCVGAYLRRSAKDFVVLDDRDLRLEPRQSNLRNIYHRAPRVPRSMAAYQAALSHHERRFPLPIASLTHLLNEQLIHPFSLLLVGLLRRDLDQPISSETLLHLIKEEDDVWFCIAQGHDF